MKLHCCSEAAWQVFFITKNATLLFCQKKSSRGWGPLLLCQRNPFERLCRVWFYYAEIKGLLEHPDSETQFVHLLFSLSCLVHLLFLYILCFQGRRRDWNRGRWHWSFSGDSRVVDSRSILSLLPLFSCYLSVWKSRRVSVAAGVTRLLNRLFPADLKLSYSERLSVYISVLVKWFFSWLTNNILTPITHRCSVILGLQKRDWCMNGQLDNIIFQV